MSDNRDAVSQIEHSHCSGFIIADDHKCQQAEDDMAQIWMLCYVHVAYVHMAIPYFW